ncbi:hypothetical protein ACHAXR_008866 [Thalassiosira sp. AJA248-18]
MHRLSRHAHPSFAAATAAFASATCITALFGGQTSSSSSADNALAESSIVRDDALDGGRSSNGPKPILTKEHHQYQSLHNPTPSSSQQPIILASSSPRNYIPPSTHLSTLDKEKNDKNDTQQNTIECDYVIIGHGKAGRSAVQTIQQLDPSAKIVIVDPNNNNNRHQSMQHNNVNIAMKKRSILNNKASMGSIHHLPTRASYIDHSQKLIHVHPITNPSSTKNNNASSTNIHYRKSALLATGSRGAPPPESCIRQDAWSRILELRSTTLPPSAMQMHNVQSAPSNASAIKSIPVLDPPTVRSLSIMAAYQGATVAIMGSGFDALELAAYCARVSKESPSSPSNRQQSNDKKVLLIFGNSSPMSNRLPRYLSAAVTKRLRSFGMEVEERAMTRYISMDTPMTSNTAAGRNGKSSNRIIAQPQLELYTVKSYDNLDSKRMLADLLVLAPSVDGLNGTAVVPTASSTQSFTYTSSTNKSIHLPWSSLISPPLLTCYLDDGRIMVNSEFHAASSLYAAGSVAKYPNARTGQAEVAGGRHVSAEVAGEAAARNMVYSGSVDSLGSSCYVHESIPVWRSDVIPYLPGPHSSGDTTQQTQSNSTLALYSMGIHALCVGRCNSEGMATHGFWWTNTSQSSESKNGSDSNDKGSKSIGPNAFMRRATKRATLSNSKASSSSSRGSLPVYGSGVVFYLDRSGNIEGVMTWGLPFSANPKDAQSSLNNELVERMKNMVRSNGGIAIQDHSDQILRENSGANIDVGLLSYLHLVEESKYLASMALSGSSATREGSKIQPIRVNVLGRPLHRYTPTKPVELTNLGKMHRRDESGHLTEEDDLFYSKTIVSSTMGSSSQRVQESGRPPSLKRVYPMQGGTSLAGTAERALEKAMEQRRIQIERSRPPKEEPLWVRQGEEHRFVSKRDTMADAFLRNIQAGRFKDGSDAVRQAPVPQSYLDAKEKWNSWTGADIEKEDAEED